MTGEVAVVNGKMRHKHHGQTALVVRIGFVKQGLEVGLLALVALGLVHADAREGAGIGKRYGGDDALAAHVDDVAGQVGLAAFIAGYTAQHGHSGQLPQALVAVEARRAVVIARNDDDGHRGASPVNVQHGIDIEVYRRI